MTVVKKYFLLCIFCLVNSGILLAQQNQIDSLNLVLKAIKAVPVVIPTEMSYGELEVLLEETAKIPLLDVVKEISKNKRKL